MQVPLWVGMRTMNSSFKGSEGHPENMKGMEVWSLRGEKIWNLSIFWCFLHRKRCNCSKVPLNWCNPKNTPLVQGSIKITHFGVRASKTEMQMHRKVQKKSLFSKCISLKNRVFFGLVSYNGPCFYCNVVWKFVNLPHGLFRRRKVIDSKGCFQEGNLFPRRSSPKKNNNSGTFRSIHGAEMYIYPLVDLSYLGGGGYFTPSKWLAKCYPVILSPVHHFRIPGHRDVPSYMKQYGWMD